MMFAWRSLCAARPAALSPYQRRAQPAGPFLPAFAWRSLWLCCACCLCGCVGDNPQIPVDEDFEIRDDLPACKGNNDGKIELSELLFDQIGLEANYLVNPPGTLADVDVVGEQIAGRRQWDHSPRSGKVTRIRTEDPRDWWFAKHFPTATLAIAADAKGETFEVLKLEPTASRMVLMGLASREEGVTLMAYQPPIEVFRFPLEVGSKFTSKGEVIDGKLNNLPIATRDTYEIEVDEVGSVLMPSLTFSRALRVKVAVTIKSVGGVTTRLLQYQWFGECFGEIVRAVAEPGTDDKAPSPSFKKAIEYRRLSF